MSMNAIARSQQRRYITVTAQVADGYNVTKVSSAVESAVAQVSLPEGVTASFDGENEMIMDAMQQLLLMLALGILLVYLVMVAQFQSLKSPLIVMFTIPLAFTGGFAMLLITGVEVSVVSLIGFVMLVGIIVNNGIVLVDYINQLRLEGMERQDAIVEAGITRLRPILMTSITTILGLVVMAFGGDAGTALMQPVALVCMGGLLYATLMTLLVVPCMYDIISRKELRRVDDSQVTYEEGARRSPDGVQRRAGFEKTACISAGRKSSPAMNWPGSFLVGSSFQGFCFSFAARFFTGRCGGSSCRFSAYAHPASPGRPGYSCGYTHTPGHPPSWCGAGGKTRSFRRLHGEGWPGRIQHHGLVAILCRGGRNANMVKEAVEAVGLHQFTGQVGIYVVGIIAGFQNQRLPVHIAHTGKAIYRGPLLQLHLFADGPGRDNDAEIHQRGRRNLADGGNLGRKRIAHALAAGIGISHKSALAPLAHHQPLLLQIANGLTDSVAADIHGAAKLCLGRQQVAHIQLARRNILFNNAHKLTIQRNVTAEIQLAGKNRILFHRGVVPFPCLY